MMISVSRRGRGTYGCPTACYAGSTDRGQGLGIKKPETVIVAADLPFVTGVRAPLGASEMIDVVSNKCREISIRPGTDRTPANHEPSEMN
jgi:hypothetical protein